MFSAAAGATSQACSRGARRGSSAACSCSFARSAWRRKRKRLDAVRTTGRMHPVIAGTMEDTEALGFRFDPLSGDRCASSGERRPRAFVHLVTAPRASAVSLNGLLGRVHRPFVPRRRADQAVSEALGKSGGSSGDMGPRRLNRFLMGALGPVVSRCVHLAGRAERRQQAANPGEQVVPKACRARELQCSTCAGLGCIHLKASELGEGWQAGEPFTLARAMPHTRDVQENHKWTNTVTC